jgi:hypothetical protein
MSHSSSFSNRRSVGRATSSVRRVEQKKGAVREPAINLGQISRIGLSRPAPQIPSPMREVDADKRDRPIQPMRPRPIIPAPVPGISAVNWPQRRKG